MTDPVADLARRRNDLPLPDADTSVPLPRRLLTSWWTWAVVALSVVFLVALLSQYLMLTADIPVEGGVIQGINTAAIRSAAWYALPTLAFWTIVFIWADRYRPQRLVVWYLVLGWGAAIATFISLHVNTWAAQQLAVTGNGDPATSARAAIFVAPFVEEAAKASVLFLIAILARYRLTSKVSMIVLAGLSAAGFAFTENIIYYARAIMYSSQNISVGDAAAAVNDLVWLRGFWTCFGHPLFTMMTGIGVAVALRTRSKVVRVLAPLVGYGAAALLHMVFNSQVSLNNGLGQRILYIVVALPMVLGAVIYVVRQVLAQGKVLANRLGDYAQLGWLPASDPVVFARQRLRWWAVMVAATRGWKVFSATVRLERTLTELAYLRDGQVRGIYDEAATVRARYLVEQAKGLRGVAIDDPRGLKLSLPRLRRPRPVTYVPPSYPGPAGIGGNWPAPVGQPPIGSPGYSAVDPTWGPPKG
ncbi:MAG: PrsW family intramembrane metalloprotease [Actinobacteria bacterium HGW-Actinobacteria-5]|jgi:RsiW-degrading membrane proteinase PrsW (M82 family)|nr:MAG: PrsW family intramembrane metalloprotease [Actinobacteria bacterium HGW-Actinobacteria-5]